MFNIIILFHQAPVNDNKACTSMFGVTPSTTKAHIVRAILEAIAYRYIYIVIQAYPLFIPPPPAPSFTAK